MPAALVRRLAEAFGWACHYCGTSLDGQTATVDHIVLTAAKGNDGVRREAYIDGSCATYERPDLLTLTQLIPIARDAPAGGPT